MASKRKAESGAIVPQQKTRTDSAKQEEQLGWQSDDSTDYKIEYTDNGTLRADSEARRAWAYICTFEGCNQRFNRPCRLEAHVRSHTKERPFACTEPRCDKTFPRKDHLQRHIRNAHSDPATERTLTCGWQGCGKSFTSNGRLQRHREAHETKFYCTEYPPCNEAFRKEKTLEAHIKAQHLEVKPYPCTYVDPETGERCTNGYQSEGGLKRHVYRMHSSGQESSLFCMMCALPGAGAHGMQLDMDEMDAMSVQPQVFATEEELKAHVQECHPPECTQCGQKFKSDSTLRSHVSTVHADPSQQPQFPCPNASCDSVFNRRHNLVVHIQTVHDKQFKYSCTSDALQDSKHADLRAWNGENACGATFKGKSSRDQHVRTHHLGLGNRKQLRKAAKSKKKAEPTTLSMLTGVGYEQTRDIPCLAQPCSVRFYMDRDLRRHLRAAHAISEDDIEEMVRERDALTGGQFWIGGLDDDMGMFDSVEPSMPQTPVPYFKEGAMPIPTPMDAQMKPTEPRFFDDQFDNLSLVNEDAEMDMDMAMGLGNLPPATDVQGGLQWDMLAPVEHYNMYEQR